MNNSLNASLEAAIAMSNRGAYCLVGGDALAAIRLTRRAMHDMKGIYDIDRCAYRNGVVDCYNDDAMRALPLVSDLRQSQYAMNAEASLQQNDLYYIYSRPMVLPANLEGYTHANNEALFHTLCLHITFNLALACHRLGIESGSSALQQRAKCLYAALLGAPFVSLDSHLTRYTFDVVTGSLLLRCLIQNNLACLHYEHCEYDESEFHLGSMYEMMIQCGGFLATDPANICLTVSAHEAGELILNGRLLRRPHHAEAA